MKGKRERKKEVLRRREGKENMSAIERDRGEKTVGCMLSEILKEKKGKMEKKNINLSEE